LACERKEGKHKRERNREKRGKEKRVLNRREREDPHRALASRRWEKNQTSRPCLKSQGDKGKGCNPGGGAYEKKRGGERGKKKGEGGVLETEGGEVQAVPIGRGCAGVDSHRDYHAVEP